MPTQTSLPNSIIGEDYLKNYDDGNPDVWTGSMSYFSKWICNTARLGFSAPDTGISNHAHSRYDQSKMDKVISIFASNGIKVILDLHNIGSDHNGYLGSTKWFNFWKNLAAKYVGDSRIAGFNLYNEPTKNNWASNVRDTQGFFNINKQLIQEIRAIDPSRKIFFPTVIWMGIGCDSPQAEYDYLSSSGISMLGNIVKDIIHPYLWENEGKTPEQVAADFENQIIIPCVQKFGASNCWIGETFAFPENWENKGYTESLQVRYLTALINTCLKHGVGIQVWSFFGKRSTQEKALSASKYLQYVGSTPPETPEVPETPETPETPEQPQDVNALAIAIFTAALAALKGNK